MIFIWCVEVNCMSCYLFDKPFAMYIMDKSLGQVPSLLSDVSCLEFFDVGRTR